MSYYESACQGDAGSSPDTKYYESFCQGDPASAASDKFFQSVMAFGGGDTYLIQFTVDITATSFEIIN